MPEYLAPGVYVEEVSFRAKSIEGVGTTTTGFVGPTRYGPVDLPLDVVTSLGEFERVYGDRQQMAFSGSSTTHNWMWHGVRAFFEEGGKRLYMARIFRPLDADVGNLRADGMGRVTLNGSGANSIAVRARFPGAAGNMRVRFTLSLGQNVLTSDAGTPVVRGVLENDTVYVTRAGSPPTVTRARAVTTFDSSNRPTWNFAPATGTALALSSLNPAAGDTVQAVSVTVTIYPVDPGQSTWVYSGLALDRRHKVNGAADSMEEIFSPTPNSIGAARTIPIVLTVAGTDDGLNILGTLLAADANLENNLLRATSTDLERSIDRVLDGGNDGQRPNSTQYEGTADIASTKKTGLKALEDIDEIAIVAAPGSTFGYQGGYQSQASANLNLLISHAARMRYRIAVLDSGEGQSIADVRVLRARLDSTYAALYYPWITVLDPVTQAEIQVPPSGAVCGIYARNDINRAVYKAPANEVVNTAIGLETLLNKAQQDVLNPAGVNCFRFFEGRGYRLWGARTISSDPEWKYVNLRRYFAYVEHSIDKGTQWAVFEPNGEQLWSNVRSTIEDFLLNEWQNGALLGDKPEKAYFVRCDRSTMTQNDLDNGRLICLIGVAALRPAEFVIFRIGQWTSDRKQ